MLNSFSLAEYYLVSLIVGKFLEPVITPISAWRSRTGGDHHFGQAARIGIYQRRRGNQPRALIHTRSAQDERRN